VEPSDEEKEILKRADKIRQESDQMLKVWNSAYCPRINWEDFWIYKMYKKFQIKEK
jgi:hypothetical protein